MEKRYARNAGQTKGLQSSVQENSTRVREGEFLMIEFHFPESYTILK